MTRAIKIAGLVLFTTSITSLTITHNYCVKKNKDDSKCYYKNYIRAGRSIEPLPSIGQSSDRKQHITAPFTVIGK